mmetsp:Transcript_9247/g.18748  ORF Transcript_9247/g.18748 Transcript_9247/m.18748 type:complete len:312 (+) Transcript_9247:118-1053(+)
MCVCVTSHLLGLDNVVDDGIEEDSANSDGATEKLDGVKRLSKDESDTDDNNDTLGSVSNRLGDCGGLLDGHSGKLVVSVPVEAGGDEVERDDGVGLVEGAELAPLGTLLDDEDGDGNEEGQDGGDGELVSNGAKTILDSRGGHELLVLVALEGGEQVTNAGGNESGPGKVELLDRGKDNAANDDGKAGPLSLGNLPAVDKLRKNCRKGRLGRLDNLSKGNRPGGESKDGGRVGTHSAEGDGEHGNNIVESDLRTSASVRGDPHEKAVEATNAHLKGGDCHGETGLPSSSFQSQLVCDVVVVVTHVPEQEVG